MIKQYAVFEKVPAHTNKPDSVILAPYKTIEEAKSAMIKYGYNTDNYYIDSYDKIVEDYISNLQKTVKRIPYNDERWIDYEYNRKFSKRNIE